MTRKRTSLIAIQRKNGAECSTDSPVTSARPRAAGYCRGSRDSADTARAEHKPHKINPHYGFIRRSCLTDQLPLPPLTGIGHNRQPRTVHFNPIGNGHRIRTLRVRGNPTMRDAVHAFAIGNLSTLYHDTFVIGTRRCRVSNRRSYVHGYAPAARRWGYVEASRLSGCRAHHG